MMIRSCPTCKKKIHADHGFYFDAELNMFCESCNAIVYPTTIEKERTMSHSITPIAPATSHINQYNQNNQNMYTNQHKSYGCDY